MNSLLSMLILRKIRHSLAGVRFGTFSNRKRYIAENFAVLNKNGLQIIESRDVHPLTVARLFSTVHSFATNGRVSRYRLMDDENLYFEFCHTIVATKSNFGESRIKLAYVPLATRNHRKQKYFVDNILPSWWSLMEKNLTNISGSVLASVVLNLQEINASSQDGVLKFIRWNGIEKIAKQCLSDTKIDAKYFATLLTGLGNFSMTTSSKEIVLSDELQSKLSEAFSAIFSQLNKDDNQKNFDFIGTILDRSSALNFIKSPREELGKSVVPVCYKCFQPSRLIKSNTYLNYWHRIGLAFYRWDYNPDEKFFSNYFHAIERSYDDDYGKERFYAETLKICLLIGLKFDENGFKQIHPFWTQKTFAMMQHWQKTDVDEILNLCIRKYDGNLKKIENILSKDICDKLCSRTEFLKMSDGRLWISDRQLNSPKIKKEISHMDKNYYQLLCRQVLNEFDSNFSIESKILSQLPGTAIQFEDEKNFASKVFNNWWRQFRPKIGNLQGYMLVHPLYGLKKINDITKGQLETECELLDIHPVDILARSALKDVANEKFTLSSLKSILATVERFLLNSDKRRISDELSEEISKGFSTFFNPKYFNRKIFNHTYYIRIGELFVYAKKFHVQRPPDDHLDIIVKCCAKNFNNSEIITENFSMHTHLWDIYRFVDIFLFWNLNAEKFYANFWSLFFEEFQSISSSLGHHALKNLLMVNVLKTVLLVVLKFDKENEFFNVKQFWRAEVKKNISWFNKENVDEIFSTAKQRNKFNDLDAIISKEINDEFKSRSSAQTSKSFKFYPLLCETRQIGLDKDFDDID